ncbi:hypothetical protein B0H14DRAFT_2590640 [Mycena olivaceomarginata]|nr:hypothetical protein B0H14DRAFT_2590640 [Mycena olivaceomarginata]
MSKKRSGGIVASVVEDQLRTAEFIYSQSSVDTADIWKSTSDVPIFGNLAQEYPSTGKLLGIKAELGDFSLDFGLVDISTDSISLALGYSFLEQQLDRDFELTIKINLTSPNIRQFPVPKIKLLRISGGDQYPYYLNLSGCGRIQNPTESQIPIPTCAPPLWKLPHPSNSPPAPRASGAPSVQLSQLAVSLNHTEEYTQEATVEAPRSYSKLRDQRRRLCEVAKTASRIKCRILRSETEVLSWKGFRSLSKDIGERITRFRSLSNNKGVGGA